jgi:subtilase family serine protease
VSVLFDRPSWQQGFPAPFLKRSFPDVAFNGDPNTGQNALIHLDMGNRDWFQIGGTSIGAPQWAGFLALVNAARAGKPRVGYLNPIIYGMTADQRKQGFHDITHGGNGGYSAGVGWDATTGWGSMRASVLLNLLKN